LHGAVLPLCAGLLLLLLLSLLFCLLPLFVSVLDAYSFSYLIIVGFIPAVAGCFFINILPSCQSSL
jgi:hypothetical protein